MGRIIARRSEVGNERLPYGRKRRSAGWFCASSLGRGLEIGYVLRIGRDVIRPDVEDLDVGFRVLAQIRQIGCKFVVHRGLIIAIAQWAIFFSTHLNDVISKLALDRANQRTDFRGLERSG